MVDLVSVVAGAYRFVVELPAEARLVAVDVARRDARRSAINVQLLIQLVTLP